MIGIVGCEESQAVTKAFRAMGHEFYSCDLKPCSGGHPEWHIQGDIFEAIERLQPEIAIYHPPCTYLTVTANKWLKDQPERESGALVGGARRQAKEEALIFVRNLMNSNVPKIAIENPVGCISTRIYWHNWGPGPDRWEVSDRHLEKGGREPEQIIQPYQFGHPEPKATCLWLKGLPPLKHTQVVKYDYHISGGKKYSPTHYNIGKFLKKMGMAVTQHNKSELRSKTFPGIANAMAEQWGAKDYYSKELSLFNQF